MSWFVVQLDDTSVPRHKGERRVRTLDDDTESTPDPASDAITPGDDICLDNDSDSDDGEKKSVDEKHLSVIKEDDGTTGLDAGDDPVKTEQWLKPDDGVVDSKDGDKEEVEERQTEDVKEEKEEGRTTELDLESVGGKTECLSSETSSLVAKQRDAGKSDEIVFPDTSIELQHVKGNKYVCRIPRVISTFSG